jgi:hypothetical protein
MSFHARIAYRSVHSILDLIEAAETEICKPSGVGGRGALWVTSKVLKDPPIPIQILASFFPYVESFPGELHSMCGYMNISLFI